MKIVDEDDLVLLVSHTRKRYLIRLTADAELHTHRGIVKHDDIIGKPLGREITTHLGAPFVLFTPSLSDLLQEIKRATQIIYPKDISYILLNLNIQPGCRVLEAGTGSGGLTIALARYVGTTGMVYSYEVNENPLNVARQNLEMVGLCDRVTLKQRDIAKGFDETDVDALFLDVREPWDFIDQTRAALVDGGFFGAIVPTTNQVARLIQTLMPKNFSDIEVSELLLRHYKANPNRLRPTDRMVAHTGYLIFARKMSDITN